MYFIYKVEKSTEVYNKNLKLINSMFESVEKFEKWFIKIWNNAKFSWIKLVSINFYSIELNPKFGNKDWGVILCQE